MSNIPPDQLFIRKKEIIDAKINNESVMMCMERSSYFSLDEIGTRVWDILAEPYSLRRVCDILIREYDIDHLTAMIEIGTLIQDLIDHNLIIPEGVES